MHGLELTPIINLLKQTTQTRLDIMNTYTIDGSDENSNKDFSEAISRISFNFANSDASSLEALAAKFPKYCKGKASGVSGGGYGDRPRISYRTLSFDVDLRTNKVTGDVNETAVKRRLKVLEIIKKLKL